VPQPVQAEVDPSVDMTTPPLNQVNALSAADYFVYAADAFHQGRAPTRGRVLVGDDV
jgi:hypothetical protein